jgi:hypothetical protein
VFAIVDFTSCNNAFFIFYNRGFHRPLFEPRSIMSAWHASSAICGQDYKLPAISTVLRAKTMEIKQLKAACLS